MMTNIHRRTTHKPDQRGAASVEFFVISLAVFIPLLMAVLQMGLFFVAKNTVNLATFAAARAGASTGGSQTEMRKAFLKAVAPLYVGAGLRVLGSAGFTDVSQRNYAPVMGAAYLAAATNLPIDQITKLNPTAASFRDFGIRDPSGGSGRIIPVTNLITDARVGASSQQTRADSLLLKVEIKHCYHMIFPVIDKLVSQTLLVLNPSAALTDKGCYLLDGIPIASQAVVRMTVPPEAGNFP